MATCLSSRPGDGLSGQTQASSILTREERVIFRLGAEGRLEGAQARRSHFSRCFRVSDCTEALLVQKQRIYHIIYHQQYISYHISSVLYFWLGRPWRKSFNLNIKKIKKSNTWLEWLVAIRRKEGELRKVPESGSESKWVRSGKNK